MLVVGIGGGIGAFEPGLCCMALAMNASRSDVSDAWVVQPANSSGDTTSTMAPRASGETSFMARV